MHSNKVVEMGYIQSKAFLTSAHKLFESSNFSDLTISCGPDQYELHRVIVCERCSFFATACDGNFREAKTAHITLKEDDPPTVRRMLTYLYTFDYDVSGEAASMSHYMLDEPRQVEPVAAELLSEKGLVTHQELMNHIAVYAIAGKYNIPDLEELAKQRFCCTLSESGPPGDLPTIIDAVFHITRPTDTSLRVASLDYCSENIASIIERTDLEQLVRDHVEIGVGAIRFLLSRHELDAEIKCLEEEVFAHERRMEQESEAANDITMRDCTWCLGASLRGNGIFGACRKLSGTR